MTGEKHTPKDPAPLNDDALAEVAGGVTWTVDRELFYKRWYIESRQEGSTTAKTFEEYLEQRGLTADRQAWFDAGRPGWGV